MFWQYKMTYETVACLFVNTLMEMELNNHVKDLEALSKKPGVGGEGRGSIYLFFFLNNYSHSLE